MTDNDDDLQPELARLLKDVLPADGATREAHIAAALGAMAPSASTVVRIDSRRRALLAAAAAVLLVAGAGAGWSARGGRTSPAAEVRAVTATTGPSSDSGLSSSVTVPDKGASPSAGTLTTAPPCTDTLGPDATYLGEYANPGDNRTYLVFVRDRPERRFTFVDKVTCAEVLLSAATTVP